jgi:hypothetical protein
MSLVRPSLRAFSNSSALAYPRFPRLALKTTARDFPSDPRFTALDEEQPARAAASGGLINEDPELPSFLRRERGSGTGPDGRQEPETAPPAWFLPDPSSSTTPMVRRPSFLPPAPRSTFVPPTEISAPPSSMPAALEDLYYHLQGHPLFVPSSATFTSTHDPAPKTIPIPDHPPQKGKRRRGAFDAGPGIPGIDAGGAWEWVVVTTVEGQGFGDVRRAEYAIREWVSLAFFVPDIRRRRGL